MVYLVCNAHIDPVWLWRWDEGASETLSTFRAAADFLDETPGFIFNHNEALLYEWVAEYEPALFARIARFVAEGRWQIIGGWYLQPDCNLPVGEALVRQILRGRRYFAQIFGVSPRTAINFDSFGHARGLVQVLRQAGYDQYLVCRPHKQHFDFASADFIWKGYEGSEILVHRSDENYNSVKGKVGEELTAWMKEYGEDADTLFLWGVGNHGGGPSRKDLQDIAALMAQGHALTHAAPEAYFDVAKRQNLPVIADGLNPVAEGCYTSQIRIKQQHRRLENDLLMVEKMAAHAAQSGLAEYAYGKLQDAWRDLLFAEFHDALPGSAIPSVEEDTLRALHHGLEITAQLKTRYFFALSSGQPKLIEDTVPLLVYNPHPFAIEGPVDCEMVLPKQGWEDVYACPVVYQDGQPLPCQPAKEEANFNMDWRKRVVFQAHLPASGMSRFDVRFEILPKRPLPTLTAAEGKITVASPTATLVVSTLTGLVEQYTVQGVDYLKKDALALQVFDDSLSAWGGPFVDQHPAPIGRFTPMTPEEATLFSGVKGGLIPAVRVIEEGAVRVTVEALLSYGHSRACQRYSLGLLDDTLTVETLVFFGEGEKRLKLSVPTTLKTGEYIGQTVFGRERLDTRPGEYVSQYWSAVADDTSALTMLNDGTYGSDFADGEARLTMLRSAGYSGSTFVNGEPYHDPWYMPRMDQGERKYRFQLKGGAKKERLLLADREAEVFNQAPYALAFCPSGQGETPRPLALIDCPHVRLSTLKRSEDAADQYILRLYETMGQATDFTVQLPSANITQALHLDPFQIQTYLVKDGALAETTLLEGM